MNVLKTHRHIPEVVDVRANEPERAMQQFPIGLRRVLAAPDVFAAESHAALPVAPAWGLKPEA